MPLKLLRCVAISLKSLVDPQIQKKSRTVEELNVNKSINQSEKAIRGTEIEQFLFDSRNWCQKKFDARCMPYGAAHAPDSGIDFVAPASGAGFWSMCHCLKIKLVAFD